MFSVGLFAIEHVGCRVELVHVQIGGITRQFLETTFNDSERLLFQVTQTIHGHHLARFIVLQGVFVFTTTEPTLFFFGSALTSPTRQNPHVL